MTASKDSTPDHPNTNGLRGIWTDHIEGRYRAIPVREIVMAWWCYMENHITYRQLRVYLAAHEMAERRRYTKPGGRTKPSYSDDELKELVGGRGSDTADAALAADVKRLAALGLVSITGQAVDFAKAAGDLALSDVSGFHVVMDKMPHKDRTVPVPRRMLRALAAGLSRGSAAVVLATLIRSLFWHKDQQAFRTDGRTKREWIADVFGVSVRSVTEGRARLIELGWLVPLETPQQLLNRYGAHDRVNTEWAGPGAGDRSGDTNDTEEGGSASLSDRFRGGSASPLNRSLPPEGNQLNNRTSDRPSENGRSGTTGVSLRSTSGSRMRGSSARRDSRRPPRQPKIRNVQACDLADTDRLLDLYRQAVEAKLAHRSEHGRLEFFSLAERARTRGRRAGALFYWLLRENKTEFITLSDEDEAARRLRQHMNRSDPPLPAKSPLKPTDSNSEKMTAGERFVVACLRVARQHRIDDPFIVARQAREWTRDQWEEAHHAHLQSQQARWYGAADAEL